MVDFTPTYASAGTVSVDNLIAGDEGLVSRSVTLLTGQNLVRGTVLGKVSVGAPTGAAVAGNTGNGTIGSVTIGTAAKPGVFKVTIIEAAANAGAFVVEDPDGVIVGHGTVAVAFSATGAPSFTIADGGTDFVAGDQFTVTVAAGTGKYLKSLSAATDGSQVPVAILAQDTDATSADKTTLVYEKGVFNENGLTLGTAHTADSIRAGLRSLGIFMKAAVSA